MSVGCVIFSKIVKLFSKILNLKNFAEFCPNLISLKYNKGKGSAHQKYIS